MNRYLEANKPLKKCIQRLLHGIQKEDVETFLGYLADLAEKSTEKAIASEETFGMRMRGTATAFRFLRKLFEDADEPDMDMGPMEQPPRYDPFPDFPKNDLNKQTTNTQR